MFLRDYWYIPLIAILLIVIWILTGTKKGDPTEGLRRELRAIDAGKRARDDIAEKDAATALALVKARYREKVEKLDETDKQKATSLESDPVALAKFLERATRS